MLSEADYQNLFKYSVALTGNEDDGFELLQQALENCIRAQSGTSDGFSIDKPMAYIRKSIKNLYIDRLRHWQKFQQVNYEACELEPILLNETPTLEDVLMTKQEFQFCWSLMSVDERELMYLSAIEGYTVQEIADDLGLRKGTVLSKLHRLKTRLRTHHEQFINDRKVV